MRPVGIVTDRDIVVRVFAPGRDPQALRAADCMSTNVLVMRWDEDVRECVRQMEQRQVRRVPVVESGRPARMSRSGPGFRFILA